jgi:hypothetical protein
VRTVQLSGHTSGALQVVHGGCIRCRHSLQMSAADVLRSGERPHVPPAASPRPPPTSGKTHSASRAPGRASAHNRGRTWADAAAAVSGAKGGLARWRCGGQHRSAVPPTRQAGSVPTSPPHACRAHPSLPCSSSNQPPMQKRGTMQQWCPAENVQIQSILRQAATAAIVAQYKKAGPEGGHGRNIHKSRRKQNVANAYQLCRRHHLAWLKTRIRLCCHPNATGVSPTLVQLCQAIYVSADANHNVLAPYCAIPCMTT